MQKLWALVCMALTVISVGAAWMRWSQDVLPPWTNVAFLTSAAMLLAIQGMCDAWKAR